MLENTTIRQGIGNGQASRVSNEPKVQNEPTSITNQSSVSGIAITRKANSYLGKHVSMFFAAEDPVFLPLEEPIWQVTVFFLRYQIGPVNLGFLDVDDATGEVIPLTNDEIQKLRKRANAFVKSTALSAAA